MNIFILDENPILAAKMYCDKHTPKMVVELLQQLGSAVIRHGATPEQMPLTKKQTPLRGGYHNHPATRWVGDSRTNYIWACHHAAMLCDEYTKRFGKVHFCEAGIEHLYTMRNMIPEGNLTPFALCMPDEHRPDYIHVASSPFDVLTDEGGNKITHATGDLAVAAYREYYHSKTFAAWDKGRDAPDWWIPIIARNRALMKEDLE